MASKLEQSILAHIQATDWMVPRHRAALAEAIAANFDPARGATLTLAAEGFTVTPGPAGMVWFYMPEINLTSDSVFSSSCSTGHAFFGWRAACLLQPPKGRFSLYRIQMAIRGSAAPADLRAQMGAGYYGVTGRPVILRWREHLHAAYANNGFALHSAMNAAIKYQWEGVPLFVVEDTADTLPGIYALEEAAVAAETLAPKGLNVIPGGYAGIRMLYELGITNNRKPNPEQRDEILVKLERQGHNGPRAHYRRGHVRTLSSGVLTWVRACFVALNNRSADAVAA